MGYVNLINKNVDFAFTAVKDLAADVVLTKKVITGFDFGSGANTAGSDIVLNVKAIVTRLEKGDVDSKKASSRNTQQKSIMLQKQDVDDVTFYDTILIAGQIWNLGKVIREDGFVVEVEAFREV
jgi:hypothetical protein